MKELNLKELDCKTSVLREEQSVMGVIFPRKTQLGSLKMA